ncbi:uncharacterized protein J3D65DRAFT_70197 [Phyllosticta citribraziliensis]|uniref:Uncharacterized protein n=1 Tax=Phyllosticta citribraziliensis TaxID=989973 RepID=A0ABR1LCZ3_9PEZI
MSGLGVVVRAESGRRSGGMWVVLKEQEKKLLCSAPGPCPPLPCSPCRASIRPLGSRSALPTALSCLPDSVVLVILLPYHCSDYSNRRQFFLHLCTKKLRCRWFCVPRMSWSAATRSTAMNETSKGANRQPPSQQVKHMLHIIHRVKRDDNASSWTSLTQSIRQTTQTVQSGSSSLRPIPYSTPRWWALLASCCLCRTFFPPLCSARFETLEVCLSRYSGCMRQRRALPVRRRRRRRRCLPSSISHAD